MPPGSLAKSVVEAPFEGLDRKTNSKLVLPGKLLELENGRFREAMTITKRNGYTVLPRSTVGGADLAAGAALGRFRNELLLFNAGTLYSYSTGLAKWASRGGVTPFSARREVIFGNQSTATNPDAATTGTITVYAWSDSRGGIRATVLDEETGAALLSDTELSATGLRPRCVVIGTHILVLYFEGANLKARRIDAASPTAWDAAVTLAVDADPDAADRHLDVIPTPAIFGFPDASALFAYTAAAGPTLGYLLETGAVATPADGFASPVQAAGEDATQAIAVVAPEATASVYVVYAGAAGVSGFKEDPGFTLGGAAAPVLIDAAVTVENLTLALDETAGVAFTLFYEVAAAATTNRIVYQSVLSGALAVSSGPALVRRSVGLASKAWFYDGVAYATVVFAGTLQTTFFVVKADGTILGRLLSQNAGGLQTGALPSMIEKSAGEFFWPAPVKTRFVSEDNVTYSRIGLAKSTLTFGGDGQYRGVEAGESFLLPGGMVSLYDGAGVVESGFHVFPELLAGVTQNAAGGAMAGSGTYGFTWIYEWYDNRGQIHRSAPAVPVSVVVPAGTNTNRCSFAVPTLRLTEKTAPRPEVRIVCYSTLKDGIVYYRTPHQGGTATDGVENDPTADTVTFERTVADASIEANEILYSQGTAGADSGELANLCPPAARLMATGKSRALLAGLENPRAWMYSKRLIPGRAPEFSDFLQGEIPEDLTAVALLDDKVVFFARDAIYVMSGDGPDNVGQNDTFSAPQLLTSDVGCLEPRSLASTPAGLLFQSAKGIHLLSRGLEVSYIGAPVEAFNGQTITATRVVDDANEVRFLTDDGLTLVYDYHVGQWATWTNHEGLDACLFGNVYHYMRSDGEVYREAEGVFTDNGVAVHMKLRTGWLKPGSIQGLKRIWRIALLGDFYSAHVLRGRIYSDFKDYYDEQFDWNPGAIFDASLFGAGNFGDGNFGGADPSADRVYQMRHHLKRQKVQAISVEIEDRGSDPGQAYSISALALEVGILPGIARLAQSKTV